MPWIWAPPSGARFSFQSFLGEKYRIEKMEKKAAFISDSIAFGKDFHYNRWRKIKIEKGIAFNC